MTPEMPETEAARALERGDALRALGLVGRAETPRALLLRGIAYAQLGDLELAETALGRAADVAVGSDRARARAALVETLLAAGDAGGAARAARASIEELRAVGDERNAIMQTLVLARAEVLLGRLHEARHVVESLGPLPADLEAVSHLVSAEIAVRSVVASRAHAALARAREALLRAPHHLLSRALAALEQELTRPVVRILRDRTLAAADLFAVERIGTGEVLLVDACRRLVLGGRVTIPLARRPVLFALLESLARAWPEEVERDALASAAFEVRKPNSSHRARLRVEIGRLRKIVDDVGAAPVATPNGYALESKRPVALLLPIEDGDDARIALLLGDGAAWSAQSLAEHAGVSVRTAQRVLRELVDRGSVDKIGRSRYVRVGTPIASRMLLLGLVPRS